MWLLTSDSYINTSAICRLEDDGGDGAMIHLVDGAKLKSSLSIDALAIMSGSIIAANPGFESVWINTTTGNVEREPVSAWRVHGLEDTLIPMTPSGRLHANAVVYPDRRVLDRDTERFHPDLDAWIVSRVEQEARKAKAAVDA